MTDFNMSNSKVSYSKGTLMSFTGSGNSSASTGTTHTGFGRYRSLTVTAQLTSISAGTTSPTAWVFVDTSFDNGSSWVNLGRSGVLSTITDVAVFSFRAEVPPAVVVATQADAAAGTQKLVAFGDAMRVRTTSTGTAMANAGIVQFLARD